ncbi:MAG: hypothetical protein GX892_13860 [Thermoanaerobacteraceae bacterium]|nr:hypothetical protein [Thermoanaerobacteraceae bacterium]
MQVGIEVYAQRAVYIMDNNFVRLKVINNGKLMEESCSEDVFKFFGTIIPGKRLAGVGRNSKYEPSYLLGSIFEANPSSHINFLFIDPEDDIKLVIETNIWLDPGIMLQDVMLKIASDKKNLEIPLNRPDIKMDWQSRGTFAIDIGDFIRELNAARIKV